ncbi:hypothetical protein BSLA_02f4260 [Burkholderia stabilis]|nr:hypothetical protein BSLA_02f4260 [Burkholderia stabilis]
MRRPPARTRCAHDMRTGQALEYRQDRIGGRHRGPATPGACDRKTREKIAGEWVLPPESLGQGR